MTFLLALGLIVGVAEARPAPYPSAAVLGAFKDLCTNPASVDAVRVAARGSDWEEFTPAPDSNLGKILANGKAMVPDATPKGGKVQMSAFAAFRRTVAGRALVASTDTVTLSGSGKTISVTGCQVYDFSAPDMLPADAMQAFGGRNADRKVDQTGQIAVWSWEPGLSGQGSNLTVAFAPSTSFLANPKRLLVLGLVVKSQHFGATQ